MVGTIVIIYFLLVLAIGVYSRLKIKTPVDFYIAGKNGGIFQVGGSLLATILGGSAILGTLELSQQNGWSAIWLLLCASLGLFILAPIAKYVNRYGKYTLPELLGSFYGFKAQYISSIIITTAWLGIIAAQIIGAAKILHSIQLLDYQTAAILAGVVFIIYTLLGGQKSILKTDLLQSIIIISGILFLFISLQNNTVTKQVLPKSLFHHNFSFIDLVILLLTYSSTFVVGPDIYSRLFCAKSEKTAKRSVLLAAIVIIPIAYLISSVGISIPQSDYGSNQIGILAAGDIYLPKWAVGLLSASLLSAVMSSADTTLLTASMIGSSFIHKDLNTQKGYLTTRIFILLLGITSIVIALYITSIIQMLLLALAFFSGAFIVPTIAGLLKYSCKPSRVTASMVSGGLLALVGKLVFLFADKLWGNILIICAFALNALILFYPIIYKYLDTSKYKD